MQCVKLQKIGLGNDHSYDIEFLTECLGGN